MNKTVYLYVCDTMADWETGYLTAELNSGRYFRKGTEPYQVATVGINRDPVITMGGIRILPDFTVEDCIPEEERIAALILPGGNTWLEAMHEPILNRVKEFLDRNITVGAICGATFGLGKADLLNTAEHTSNSLDYLKQVCPDYKGEAFYQTEPAVTSGGLITASGVAPLEFAYHVIRALDVFSPETLEAWYQLYLQKSKECFFELMGSLR